MPPAHQYFLPNNASDAEIISVVDRWAALLEAEQYEVAFAATEHDEAMGWTHELVREVITMYGDAVPGQKVTVDGKPTDIFQRKHVYRYANKNAHGLIGYVWYDLNINGFASDLTATFDIREADGVLALVLDDIHVM